MTTGPRVTRKDLKEDKVYLTMAEVVDFVVRNRLAIAATILFAIAAFALVYYVAGLSARSADEASWALYQAGYIEDSSEKIDALEKIASEYGGSQAGVTAEFELANTLYFDGKHEDALEGFDKFLKEHPRHFLAPAAREAIGFCEESLGQWNEAIRTYEGLIKDAPSGPAVARVNYRLGLCREKLGEQDKAIERYVEVVELAPAGLWARYANERLESLDPETYAAGQMRPSFFPPGMEMPFTPPPTE